MSKQVYLTSPAIHGDYIYYLSSDCLYKYHKNHSISSCIIYDRVITSFVITENHSIYFISGSNIFHYSDGEILQLTYSPQRAKPRLLKNQQNLHLLPGAWRARSNLAIALKRVYS